MLFFTVSFSRFTPSRERVDSHIAREPVYKLFLFCEFGPLIRGRDVNWSLLWDEEIGPLLNFAVRVNFQNPCFTE